MKLVKKTLLVVLIVEIIIVSLFVGKQFKDVGALKLQFYKQETQINKLKQQVAVLQQQSKQRDSLMQQVNTINYRLLNEQWAKLYTDKVSNILNKYAVDEFSFGTATVSIVDNGYKIVYLTAEVNKVKSFHDIILMVHNIEHYIYSWSEIQNLSIDGKQDKNGKLSYQVKFILLLPYKTEDTLPGFDIKR